MNYSPFKRIQVLINPKGQRVIYWSYQPNLVYYPEARVDVQKSKNCSQWQILAPNVQGTFYVDTTTASYNRHCTDYYRLHLNITDLQNYYSDPQIAGRTLCWPYTAKANNLLRLADLQIARTGRVGLLLKRKTYGQRCPLCTDFDDQQSVNQHCPKCLGTGIVGGYQKGIPLNVLEEQTQSMQNVLADGYSNAQTVVAKCLAWPFIQKGDVWLDLSRNQRYYIDSASILSRCRSVPLIYALKMNLIEYTDVMHSVEANQLVDISQAIQTSPKDACQLDKEFDTL